MSKVEYDEKFCKKCNAGTMHELIGYKWGFMLTKKKYFKCMECGAIHITDTWWRENTHN